MLLEILSWFSVGLCFIVMGMNIYLFVRTVKVTRETEELNAMFRRLIDDMLRDLTKSEE